MKKIIRLTERDLTRIVRRVINESLDNDEITFEEIYDVIQNSNSVEEFIEKIEVFEPRLENLSNREYESYMNFINAVIEIWPVVSKKNDQDY